jgi:hypothetical protein
VFVVIRGFGVRLDEVEGRYEDYRNLKFFYGVWI